MPERQAHGDIKHHDNARADPKSLHRWCPPTPIEQAVLL
jgi:hypothetical protein